MIRLGDVDEEQDNECNDDGFCLQEEDFEIDKIIVHPNYNNPRYANDIALIRLKQSTAASSKFIDLFIDHSIECFLCRLDRADLLAHWTVPNSIECHHFRQQRDHRRMGRENSSLGSSKHHASVDPIAFRRHNGMCVVLCQLHFELPVAHHDQQLAALHTRSRERRCVRWRFW